MLEQDGAHGPRVLAHILGRRRLTTWRAAVIIGVHTLTITFLAAALVRLLDT